MRTTRTDERLRPVPGPGDSADAGVPKDFPELNLRPARDLPPLLDEGLYEAQCVGGEEAYAFKRRVLFLHFVMFGGRYDGARLWMKLNLPAKGQRVSVASNFYAAWTLAAGAAPRRRDRMSLEVFRRIFRVKVTTVTRTHTGAEKLKLLRYSEITELVERLA